MPGQFAAEIAVMQEMGWSWPALMAAPIDLVAEIMERVRARSHWQRVKQKQDEARSRSKRRHG